MKTIDYDSAQQNFKEIELGDLECLSEDDLFMETWLVAGMKLQNYIDYFWEAEITDLCQTQAGDFYTDSRDAFSEQGYWNYSKYLCYQGDSGFYYCNKESCEGCRNSYTEKALNQQYVLWEKYVQPIEYDYSTEEKPNEKVISEFKSREYEQEREMEVFEHHIEDYLDEEPIKDEIILPRELINEMRREFHPIISQPDNPMNQYYQSCLAYIELLKRIFRQNEILALFRHSYVFYHTKDWENLIKKVITALESADLKSYDIENLEEFVDKINSIPGYLHFGVIDVICNSESMQFCHEFNIHDDVEQDRNNIEVDDLNCGPYNPRWEKFNKQLEKFASPNQD